MSIVLNQFSDNLAAVRFQGVLSWKQNTFYSFRKRLKRSSKRKKIWKVWKKVDFCSYWHYAYTLFIFNKYSNNRSALQNLSDIEQNTKRLRAAVLLILGGPRELLIIINNFWFTVFLYFCHMIRPQKLFFVGFIKYAKQLYSFGHIMHTYDEAVETEFILVKILFILK